ncbi:hypothetical protein V7L80_002696 [Vibrio harveyi]
MVKSDCQALATHIIMLMKDLSLSPEQQEEQLIKTLEKAFPLSPDVQRSHLNAKKLVPAYRGHLYEQRLMDALVCPDVGGRDVSDLYLVQGHPHFGNLVQNVYGDFGVRNKQFYCRTSKNGISIESKTSECQTIEAPKVSGYLDCPFEKLSSAQQGQALSLLETKKSLKEEDIRNNSSWMIDADERWADIYCFTFVDEDGECERTLLVPSFLLKEKQISGKPSKKALLDAFGDLEWQGYMEMVDWSCNNSILVNFYTALTIMCSTHTDEFKQYKIDMDEARKNSTIYGVAKAYTPSECKTA